MRLVSLLIAAMWWDTDPTDDSENFAEYMGESLGLLLLINLEELCCITSSACELVVCQSLDCGSLVSSPSHSAVSYTYLLPWAGRAMDLVQNSWREDCEDSCACV